MDRKELSDTEYQQGNNCVVAQLCYGHYVGGLVPVGSQFGGHWANQQYEGEFFIIILFATFISLIADSPRRALPVKMLRTLQGILLFAEYGRGEQSLAGLV